MGYLVYIGEDEENIRELLQCSLEAFGCRTKTFTNGKELVEYGKIHPPEVVLLDVMMPEMGGLEAIQHLRNHPKTKDVGIMMITAKSEEMDKVKALDLGADDYLLKPFGILELKSRVMALGRRCRPAEKEILTGLDIRVDCQKHEVFYQEKEVHLSNKEYGLLLCLLEGKGKVVEREELLQKVWGYDFVGESRTLDVHIKTLREKLMDKDAQTIVTVRGVGYKLKTGGESV